MCKRTLSFLIALCFLLQIERVVGNEPSCPIPSKESISFGGLPKILDSDPNYPSAIGTQAGGGNRGAAHHVFADPSRNAPGTKVNPLSEWVRAKGLESATFKTQALTGPCKQAEAAAILEQHALARKNGVGVGILGATLVGDRLVLAMENFSGPPPGATLIRASTSYQLEGLLDHVPQERRQAVALRVFAAFAHADDPHPGNVLVRVFQMQPGSKVPESAIPLGNNKYLQAAAIDLGPSPPLYGGKLSEPWVCPPRYANSPPEFQAQIRAHMPHGRAEQIAAIFGLDPKNFKQAAQPLVPAPPSRKASEFERLAGSDAPRSSGNGPSRVPGVRARAAAASKLFAESKFKANGTFIQKGASRMLGMGTIALAPLVIARMINEVNAKALNLNGPENLKELQNWMAVADPCGSHPGIKDEEACGAYCQRRLASDIEKHFSKEPNPEKQQELIAYVEELRGIPFKLEPRVLVKDFLSAVTDPLVPLRDFPQLQEASEALCTDYLWKDYLKWLGDQKPECKVYADRWQRYQDQVKKDPGSAHPGHDAYGRYTLVNVTVPKGISLIGDNYGLTTQWRWLDSLIDLDDKLDRIKPLKYWKMLVDLDTGEVLSTRYDQDVVRGMKIDRQGIPLSRRDLVAGTFPQDEKFHVMTGIKQDGSKFNLSATIDPEEKERLSEMMRLRKNCPILRGLPKEEPSPEKKLDSCDQALHFAETSLPKLETMAECNDRPYNGNGSPSYWIGRIAGNLKAAKEVCPPNDAKGRDTLIKAFERRVKIFENAEGLIRSDLRWFCDAALCAREWFYPDNTSLTKARPENSLSSHLKKLKLHPALLASCDDIIFRVCQSGSGDASWFDVSCKVPRATNEELSRYKKLPEYDTEPVH